MFHLTFLSIVRNKPELAALSGRRVA